jgi:adenylate cyclase
MWGVEIHAHAIATLLQRGFVREPPQWVNLIAICLLAAIVCPFVTVCRLQWAACATLGLLVGYFVFNVWLFVDHGVWLHLIAPSTAMFLVAAGVLLDRGLIEEREKKRAYGLLRRFLSPQTAEYVIANPDKCVLGGERVTATVMFADVRGFTAMSERLAPEQVVALLNDYLQAMTDIVFKHEGTVDKYVGDCIMALFGIPVPYADHARRAVAAAIDMQSALLHLHEKRQVEGLPPLDMGVGINTGEMVFGMMGADERWDFTVIGDAVNLAARVEGLNAEMNSCILITQSTYELVKDEVEVWGPLTARVKGKAEEVIVYGVFGWRGTYAETSVAVSMQGSVAMP